LGLKLTRTRPDEAGRVALIRVKISSGNAGFERAVLPGAILYIVHKRFIRTTPVFLNPNHSATHFFTVTGAQFHQRSTFSFYMRRSQKRKTDSQVVNLFYAFGIYERKSCT